MKKMTVVQPKLRLRPEMGMGVGMSVASLEMPAQNPVFI
jgi:hypothetical protein